MDENEWFKKSLKVYENMHMVKREQDHCPLWLYFHVETFAKEQHSKIPNH